MVEIIRGDRAGKQGRIAVGCSAAVIDPETQKILLIRRADSGRWSVPGGYMEPGESCREACAREVWEDRAAGWYAVALLLTTPLYFVLGQAMSTDIFLFLGWTIALWSAWRALFCDRPWAWITFGLAEYSPFKVEGDVKVTQVLEAVDKDVPRVRRRQDRKVLPGAQLNAREIVVAAHTELPEPHAPQHFLGLCHPLKLGLRNALAVGKPRRQTGEGRLVMGG